MGIKFYDSNGKYWGEYDETRNLFIPFKKRTMRDCYNCKRYEAEDECIECHYEPKDEPQDECAKEYEELGLKELKELIEADRKTEPQRNMAEDIVESFGFKAESYRQAKAKTEPSGYNLLPVEDEPQTERSE